MAMDSQAGNAQPVRIEPNGIEGLLGLTGEPKGIVLFAHGSGSGRFSPRNNHVAEGLRRAGCATLLLDLLRPEEEANRANVFDIRLLATRLIEAAHWARQQPALAQLPVGFFGASTGAGAALVAAAEIDTDVAAVVSRGGRPDLAGSSLGQVRAPTLLIVGSLDSPVIDLNRLALTQLRAKKELVIVPGATHLFEEPGTLDQVLELATRWFTEHFAGSPT